MKKIKLLSVILCLVLAVCSNSGKAQNKIAVQHGSIATFFGTLDSALTAAVNGDYLYLPGGLWTLDNMMITKGVHIVGVGYNPDSTTATGITQINAVNTDYNYIFITTGADNGSITGVQFNNTILFGGNNSDGNTAVDNYSFTRCRFLQYAEFGWSPPSSSQNLFLSENIFDNYVYGIGISGVIASKNIFTYTLDNFTASTFNNNIFMGQSAWKITTVTNCELNNNIIMDNGGVPYFVNGSGNILSNNIYNDPDAGQLGDNTEINAIFSADPIFVNFTGYAFDFAADYHLDPASPGKNHGGDGTDVGIYGSSVPFKVGGLPYTPHIKFQSVGTSTDNQGRLTINIHVGAQGN
jgi:hypothetical protein